MASLIIPLPFVLLNLQKSGKEEEKIQKFKYFKNEKSFLEEIKNIFHSFWRAIICWKNQKLIKKQRIQTLINPWKTCKQYTF